MPFDTHVPAIDESPRRGESAGDLVYRLSEAKARAIGATFPDRLIIGSDQVAVNDGAVVGKPGTKVAAIKQLMAASGREVTFLTGISVLDSTTGIAHTEVAPTRVQFKTLSEVEVAAYVDSDEPLDCAGSFKCEGLGIVLFKRIDSDDPTALTGLPLIALTRLLQRHGFEVLKQLAQI